MGSRTWKGLSNLLVVLFIILFSVGVIAYFYSINYVTLLGTYTNYPYRGYVLVLGAGAVFCFVGSFAANEIGHKLEKEEPANQDYFTSQDRQCPFCGARVPPNAIYCQKCAHRIQ